MVGQRCRHAWVSAGLKAVQSKIMQLSSLLMLVEMENSEMMGKSTREIGPGSRIAKTGIFLIGLAAGIAIAPFVSVAGGDSAVATPLSVQEQAAMHLATMMSVASLAVDSEVAARELVKVRVTITSLDDRVSRLEKGLLASASGVQ